MSFWLFVGAYVLVSLVMVRVVFLFCERDEPGHHSNRGSAILVGLFWPYFSALMLCVGLIFVVMAPFRLLGKLLFAPPKKAIKRHSPPCQPHQACIRCHSREINKRAFADQDELAEAERIVAEWKAP